jgi:hypothetical protein
VSDKTHVRQSRLSWLRVPASRVGGRSLAELLDKLDLIRRIVGDVQSPSHLNPRMAQMAKEGSLYALLIRQESSDLGDRCSVCGMHRRSSQALDHADAGNDDPIRPHPLDQPIQQHPAVGQTEGFSLCPGSKFRSYRPGEVAETMTLLDRRQLLVSGGPSTGKQRDRIRVGLNLIRDMIEHDAGQQLAASQISARKMQAAKLKRVAQPGLRRPALADGRTVLGTERMVAQNLSFGLGQRQQRVPLLLCHRYLCRHFNSFQKPLAIQHHFERGL